MEIIFKKLKINSSIMNQTLRANNIALTTYKIVGWCIHKDSSWVILYDEDTKDLKKYLMIKDVEIIDNPASTSTFSVKVGFGSKYQSFHYDFTTKEEAEVFMRRIKEIKRLSEVAGQFFI